MKKLCCLTALALFLSACGSAPAYSEGDSSGDGSAGTSYGFEEEEEREPFDEDVARERAAEEVASEGYSGPCTSDCGGHDAGFAWAADGHDDYGTSRSPSFDEGQVAYDDAVEERVEEERQAYEDGEESEY